MTWYLWLPLLAIALHQLHRRQDEIIQLVFGLLIVAAMGGLIFTASWVVHLGLIVVLFVLPICEVKFQPSSSAQCDRPCLRKSLCRTQETLQ